jgi:hypothetical protein
VYGRSKSSEHQRLGEIATAECRLMADYQTATNPKTGERLIQIGGAWKPLEASATNPQTGEKAFKVAGQWIQPQRQTQPSQPQQQTYGQRVDQTGAAFDQTVRAGNAGPLRQLARTGVAAGENALSIGSGTIGDVLGAGASVITQNPQRGEAIRRLLTYQPRTAAGQAGQRYVGALTQPVGDIVQAPQRFLERHGHPIAAQALTAGEDVMGGGEAATGRLARAATPAREAAATVREAERSGFVLPVSQSQPGILSRLAEVASGKIRTQQKLSDLNVEQGNTLARKGLGLADDAPLTAQTMAEIRKQAGRDYEAVKQVPGQIRQGQKLGTELDDIADSRKGGIRAAAQDDPIVQTVDEIQKGGPFTTEQALNEIRALRDDAERSFRAGDKRLGSDYKRIAAALEERIGDHLTSTGAPPEILDRFRDARRRIAQSYDVEDSLDGAGNVDLQRLGKTYAKGRLSGDIATAGKFGKQFPKYAQVPAKRGSDLPASLVGTAAGGIVGGAHGAAGMAGALAGRMALQRATTSRLGQRAIGRAQTGMRRAARALERTSAGAVPIANTLQQLGGSP